MRVRYLPPAESEFDEALAWYRERSATASHRLAHEVAVAEKLLMQQPKMGTPSGGQGVRLFRVHGFPYTLVYALEPSEIVVVALAHQKRQAGYWQHRLKDSR